MRIEIVMNDLTKLMVSADTVTVLRQEYYDLHKNLSQVVPITQDINNLENCAKLIVEECKSKQCKSVVIPSISGVKAEIGFSENFIIELIKQEIFKEILLKPDDYFLEKIIIHVNNENNKKKIRKELIKKSNICLKARQLSFILDVFTLNLSQKEICELHYIDENSYWKYLETFSAECKQELLIRAENIFISKHGKEMKIIFDMIKKLTEVNQLYIELSKEQGRKSQQVLQKVIESEYLIYWGYGNKDYLLSHVTQ